MKILKNLQITSVIGKVCIFALGLLVGGMFIKIQYLEKNNQAAVPSVQQQQPTAPAAPTKVDVKVAASDPIRGDVNAKLTIVEFSDFQCPFCEKFQTDTYPQIAKEYIDTGKVRFVYKNLAFLGTESTDAANAALCAKEQNKYWEYHDKLFASQSGENQGAFAPDKLKKFAADLGLNTDQFNSCLDTKKYNAQVQADIAEANKSGLTSTPSFAVGTTAVIGAQPYAQFKAAIDAQLAGK